MELLAVGETRRNVRVPGGCAMNDGKSGTDARSEVNVHITRGKLCFPNGVAFRRQVLRCEDVAHTIFAQNLRRESTIDGPYQLEPRDFGFCSFCRGLPIVRDAKLCQRPFRDDDPATRQGSAPYITRDAAREPIDREGLSGID